MQETNIYANAKRYVICSTLNQMVNYMPLINMEESVEIINITRKMEAEKNSRHKRFDNMWWDENLKAVIKRNKPGHRKIESIKVEDTDKEIESALDEFFHLQKDRTIESELSNLEESSRSGKTIWNITGGQRHIVLGILKWLSMNYSQRQDDIVIYYEGTMNRLYYSCVKNNAVLDFVVSTAEYKDNSLTLEDYLNLSGYKPMSEGLTNYLDDLEKITQEKREERKKEEKVFLWLNDKNLRKERNNIDDDKDAFIELIGKLNKSNSEGKSHEALIKEYIGQVIDSGSEKNVNEQTEKYYKIICKTLKDKIQKKNFGGYFLEKIALFEIKKTVEKLNHEYNGFFTGLYHSVHIDKRESEKNLELKISDQLCELDIVLTTKIGQLIIFECKSGTATSEALKSRVYTSYAIGGVYGKPILITVLRDTQIEEIYEEYRKNRTYTTYNENYQKAMVNQLEAFRAAHRSNIEIWGIDNIEESLINLFEGILTS